MRNHMRTGCFLLVVLAYSPALFADILHVPDDYEEIGLAVQFAVSGDTILLEHGFYQEHVEVTNHALVFGSRYLLDGDETHIEQTVWDINPGLDSCALQIRSVEPRGSEVSGISFLTGDAFRGGSIYARYVSDLHVHDCRFIRRDPERADMSYFGGAVCAASIDTLLLTNNHFTGLKAAMGGALFADTCGFVGLYENTFLNNTSGYGGGVISTGRSSGIIEGNLIKGNSSPSFFGGAILIAHKLNADDDGWIITDNRIMNNTAYVDGGAIFVDEYPGVVIDRNYFRGNRVSGTPFPVGGAIRIDNGSPGYVISNNTFRANYSTKDAGSIDVSGNGEIHHNIIQGSEGGTVGAVYVRHLSSPGTIDTVHVYDNLISGTICLDTTYYYAALTTGPYTHMILHSNDFYDNDVAAAGLLDNPVMGTMEAADNYWGDASGPYHPDENPEGMGDTVTTNISIVPFSQSPFTQWRPPSPFDLIEPEPGALVSPESVQFVWQQASDPNPGDSVTYSLQMAQDDHFSENLITLDAETDTSFAVTDLDLGAVLYWRVVAEDTLGLKRYSEVRSLWVVSAPEQETPTIPEEWALESPYPNPFNSILRVKIAVPRQSEVEITILDLLGRNVAQLHRGPLTSGQKSFLWQLRNLATGLYLVRATAPNWTASRKVIYLK